MTKEEEDVSEMSFLHSIEAVQGGGLSRAAICLRNGTSFSESKSMSEIRFSVTVANCISDVIFCHIRQGPLVQFLVQRS